MSTELDEYKKLLKTNEKVIVDFSAEWCGPCKRIAPTFKSLADKYPEIVFVKVDVDDSAEIAEFETISAMPTFKAYHKGKVFKTLTGGSEEKLTLLVTDLSKV